MVCAPVRVTNVVLLIAVDAIVDAVILAPLITGGELNVFTSAMVWFPTKLTIPAVKAFKYPNWVGVIDNEFAVIVPNIVNTSPDGIFNPPIANVVSFAVPKII